MKKILLVPSLDSQSPNKVACNISEGVKYDNCLYVKNKKKEAIFYKLNTERFDVKKILSSNQIIHTHGFVPDFITFVAKLINPKVKTVSTIHSVIDVDINESKSKFLSPIIIKLWILSLKNKNKVICLNNKSKRFLESSNIKNVVMIKNGVDCDKVRVAKKVKTNNQGKIKLVSWSAIREMKGHQYVIDVLAKNKDLIFELAGDGPYLQKLKSIAQEKKAYSQCVFLGYQKDLSIVMKNADVFIMASEFEGVPLALIEAVINNIPCVCNDIEPLREMFNESEVVFCDVTNSDSLEKAIREAYNNQKNYSERAYNRAIKDYTISAMNKQYQEIFSEVESK